MLVHLTGFAETLEKDPPREQVIDEPKLKRWSSEGGWIDVSIQNALIPFRKKLVINIATHPTKVIMTGSPRSCHVMMSEIRYELNTLAEQRKSFARRLQGGFVEHKPLVGVALMFLVIGGLGFYGAMQSGSISSAFETQHEASTQSPKQTPASQFYQNYEPTLKPVAPATSREEILDVIGADDVEEDDSSTSSTEASKPDPATPNPGGQFSETPDAAPDPAPVEVETLPLLERFGSTENAPSETPEYVTRRAMDDLREEQENEFGISRLPDRNSYVGASGNVTLATPGGGNLDAVEDLGDFGFKIE